MKKSGKPHAHNGKWRIRHTDISGRRISLVFDSRLEAEIELARLELLRAEAKRNLTNAFPPEPLTTEKKNSPPRPSPQSSEPSILTTQVLTEIRELKESLGPKFPEMTESRIPEMRKFN